MNYRHIYHAGNFADVLKHAVLALIIDYYKRKPKPFRVIDTHAGIGSYDLTSLESEKTGEAKFGIYKLLQSTIPDELTALLRPYLEALHWKSVAPSMPEYPGSPLLARRLLRPADVLIANELHPEDVEVLRSLFSKDRQVKVLNLDGWSVLKATLPPKERRGIILIDPPFEQPGEFDRLVASIVDARERFETGALILWYPIKDQRGVAQFKRRILELNLHKALSAELFISPRDDDSVLTGTGLIVVNPPFGLLQNLKALLPFLTSTLAQAPGGGWQLEWLGKDQSN